MKRLAISLAVLACMVSTLKASFGCDDVYSITNRWTAETAIFKDKDIFLNRLMVAQQRQILSDYVFKIHACGEKEGTQYLITRTGSLYERITTKK